MSEETRAQVAAQCRAVAHLASALAEVYDANARMFDAGHLDTLIDFVGDESAGLMETLGDILNGMDAVDKADKWLDPIFKKANQLWPQNRPGMPLAPDLE